LIDEAPSAVFGNGQEGFRGLIPVEAAVGLKEGSPMGGSAYRPYQPLKETMSRLKLSGEARGDCNFPRPIGLVGFHNVPSVPQGPPLVASAFHDERARCSSPRFQSQHDQGSPACPENDPPKIFPVAEEPPVAVSGQSFGVDASAAIDNPPELLDPQTASGNSLRAGP
jgi:hypothetical protein